MSEELREPDRVEPEVIVREKDSPDTETHNERMRTVGRSFMEEVPANVRTVRAMRNRRRVIE
jgi:hypothetical protein